VSTTRDDRTSPGAAQEPTPGEQSEAPADADPAPPPLPVSLNVNGERVHAVVEPRQLLVQLRPRHPRPHRHALGL